MTVRDVEGNTVGEVKDLRIDDMTGELRSIVVEEREAAGLAATSLEIPADHFDIGDGEIHLMADARGINAPRREGA